MHYVTVFLFVNPHYVYVIPQYVFILNPLCHNSVLY